jgi:hypothetical protein
MARLRPSLTRPIAIVILVVAGAACSSTSDEDAATEQQLAEQLVAATQAADVAPRLTVGVAESLYGTDAPAVCEAFEGGTTTAAELVLRGNLAQGRRKTITDDAVTYAGLVVQTYCPDVLPDFEAAVGDLDPFETDN